MGIKDTNQCNFCKRESDSLIHIYCECPILASFWSDVHTFLCTILKDERHELVLNNQTIILGYCGQEPWGCLTNFIILFAKHFVHCCYWTNKLPSFDTMFIKLKYHHDVEMDIAIARNKIEKHIQKYKDLNAIW